MNGRYERATLANTFGLSVEVCPVCRIMNPHGVGEPKPAHCHDCGAILAGCDKCGAPVESPMERCQNCIDAAHLANDDLLPMPRGTDFHDED